ncbi:hypothetical protein J2T60_000561 [Natronospira proteinivora]|uniref:Uncharacterized protein n=1 Tax=Natronospira proteinivora TaxID=1807133 RepID=A0ABT1G5L8_9GAMM|nr:hypothetical protein [Natronospira proteinivora]MCP1726596.1 hypothetical protein [Natronospira proteinivora]
MNRYLRWQQLRRMGRARYILRYGILGWALPVAVLGLLLLGLSARALPSLGFMLVMLLVVTPIFGALVGLWAWEENERRFGGE